MIQVSSGGVMGCPFARARVCGGCCKHHRGRGGRTCSRGGRGPQAASQISQAVPQLDVARPFAPQLPQAVPQVQALARRGA